MVGRYHQKATHFFGGLYHFEGEDRCEGDEYEEDRSWEGDFAEDAVDVFSGVFAYFNTWYKCVATLELVCHFCGVDEDGGIEEAP